MIQTIPENVRFVLYRLTKAGFTAYIVGGCVRDLLMGRIPHDYDITTNALPEQTKAVFSDFQLVLTGQKHGTVAVIISHEMIEITTYRIDGEYEDFRHPKAVTFTDRIEDDLARRDFTMNAIAMDSCRHLVDPFSGARDIKSGLIRCVGNPDVRFSEDALRILRALRFSSVLGFDIESETDASIHKNRMLLQNISCERILTELSKQLVGKNAGRVIHEHTDVLNVRFFCGYLTKNINETEPDLALRFALCLYDAEDAESILLTLRSSNALMHEVTDIISYAKALPKFKPDVRRAVGKVGAKVLKKSASLAKIAGESDTDAVSEYIDFITENNLPCKISDLHINGNDVTSLGAKGREVGVILEKLLDMCLNDEVENERDALMNAAISCIGQ